MDAMAVTIQVTFDAADPKALGTFWAEALGYVPDPPPEGQATWEEALEAFGVPEDRWNSANALFDPDGAGPRLFFQRVPEGKTAKNRVHLDLRAAVGLKGDDRMEALEKRCAELEALGASRVERHDPDGFSSAGFIVMRDPEGNEFCLD